MSYYTDMLGCDGGYRVFEWHVNRYGEVVVYRIDKDKGRVGFCSDSSKIMAIALFAQGYPITPYTYTGQNLDTWEDVLAILNQPKRNVRKIEAESVFFALRRLGLDNPIDRIIQDEKRVYILKPKNK